MLSQSLKHGLDKALTRYIDYKPEGCDYVPGLHLCHLPGPMERDGEVLHTENGIPVWLDIDTATLENILGRRKRKKGNP